MSATLEQDVQACSLSAVHRGGACLTAPANFQFDRLLANGIISTAYIDCGYELGAVYPDLCAGVFLVCTPTGPHRRSRLADARTA